MKATRLEFLDSIRGIAAIAVVLSHFILAYNIGTGLKFDSINFSPLHLFYDGFAAVSLFFVLSGYVLTLSLEKTPNINLLLFYEKRILRIWPAYVATFLISYLLYRIYTIQQTIPAISDFMLQFWRTPISAARFIKQLFFFDKSTDLLVPQSWSLIVEMQFSFLIPFLYLVYKKTSVIAFMVLNLVLYFAFAGPYFVFHFSLGIYLALNQNNILNQLLSIKKRYKAALIILILLLYTYRYTFPVYYYNLFGKDMPLLGKDGVIWIITGVGAFLILAYCLSSAKIQHILNTRFIVFIGKISYSIYLTHFFVLIFIIPYFIALLNNAGIYNVYIVLAASLAVFLTITIIISYLLRKFVEVPFSRLGYSLFKRNKKL